MRRIGVMMAIAAAGAVMAAAGGCGGNKTAGDDRGSAASAGAASASGGSKTAGDDRGSAASAGAGVHAGQPPTGGDALPAWKLETQPIALRCGNQPLAIPAAPRSPSGPSADRALPRAEPIAVCADQPSVDAVCTCLVAAVARWLPGTGLTAPVTCKPAAQRTAAAQLVELHSAPADPDSVAAGTAFALVAAHAGAWSAVNVVESAPDVDLTTTPRASHGAAIVALETRPHPSGTLVWVQSRNQYSETDMGEQQITGAAALTICIAPSAAAQAPYCYAPIKLGAWDYTFTIARADRPDACQIREAAELSASLDSASNGLTVRLDRGTDRSAGAGRYHL